MSPLSPSPILVVVAIVARQGKILIGRRPDGTRYGGAWEFPGGKVESGETCESALTRELLEELGVKASTICLVHRSLNSFNDGGTFDVRYAIVSSYEGEARALVHDKLSWMVPAQLNDINMIAGNEDAVALLCARVWEHFLRDEG